MAFAQQTLKRLEAKRARLEAELEETDRAIVGQQNVIKTNEANRKRLNPPAPAMPKAAKPKAKAKAKAKKPAKAKA